jgi:DNA-binding transcriptional ArsR family regulator
LNACINRFIVDFGELCVCQIIELLGLVPSTVSKHMSILKQAGLVENRKEARWMYYRLPKKEAQTRIIPYFPRIGGEFFLDLTVVDLKTAA